jgi:hypothetical protein
MPDERAKDDLETYLQDHYAAAVGALELIEHLEKAHAGDALGEFFSQLHAEVKSDHEQLHNLISVLGLEESNLRNAGAWTAEKLGRVKLGFSGEDASLRLLQSIETLVVGLTGKKLLWRALAAAKDSSSILQRTDFAQLEQRAEEQIARVEAQRIEAARATFS